MNLAGFPPLPHKCYLWRRVYGLGIAYEKMNIVSDDLKWRGRKLAVKVFIGPLMLRFDVPIERQKPMPEPRGW